MADESICRNSSDKSFEVLIEDLKNAISAAGFSVFHLDKSGLVAFYRNQGVSMPENYRHAMIQMCKTENSGKSIPANPERSVFVQKFFSVYNKGGKTEIRFLVYSPELIVNLLGDDEGNAGSSNQDFAQNISNAFGAIKKIADSVV
ncbi:hypothetical protein [Pelovirga terrestris]|uniref:Uncharacterized protein n=1 Tax=Pelovirga terrestris TaxID=2771352 RepID=A0A8J6QRW3_9BACT|nr:hypothetical protein [Pelovirga terrestris]MBD1400465.1 hypothetical protein [Pelovirga terrestris]